MKTNLMLVLKIKKDRIDLPKINTKTTSKILGFNAEDYLNEEKELLEVREIFLNKDEEEFKEVFNRFNQFALKYSNEKNTLDNNIVRAVINLSKIIKFDKESRELYGEDASFTFEKTIKE
jgi:hypothetical protein